MKKNYFYALFASLMLFMAMPVSAQSFTIDQLFGKWQFTADVEFTDAATQAHKETLSGDCEAVISADENYIAKIVGFAGSTVQQNINAIGAKEGQDMVKINNLNTPQLWNNLYLANENGENPYGYWEAGTEVVKTYGPVYYNVDAVNGLITIPNFTVVTLASFGDREGTVIAKYTNVKMTLKEAETVEVSDISGDYNFKAGSGTYDTMAGSVIPTEFAVNFAKTSDDNKSYNATISVEGYQAVTLPAAFNGVSVVLSYNDTYLDEANGIRFAPLYGTTKEGKIEFKTTEQEGAFTLYGGFAFAKEVMGKAKDEVTDSLYMEYHQYYTAGTLKLPAEAPEFSWVGVYNVKVANASDVIIANTNVDASAWPAEFQMEIKEVQSINGPVLVVSSFMGSDVYTLNQGGFTVTPAADGMSATVALNEYYGMAMLQSYGGGMYLVLTNSSGAAKTLTLTLNQDGTVSIEPMFIQMLDFSTNVYTPVVCYMNMTATKVVEEEAPAFEWTGEYVLTATVDNSDYPTTFALNVVYDDSYPGYEYYYISDFMGYDVYHINNGGIALNIAEDGQSAEIDMNYTYLYSLGVGVYLKLRDKDGGNVPVALALNADGTLSADDFTVVNSSTNDIVATYSNVVLTKKDATGIENVTVENNVVEGIFDMQGRKIDAITAPGLYIVNGAKVLVK